MSKVRIVLSKNGTVSFYGDVSDRDGGVYITPEDEHKEVSDNSTSPDEWKDDARVIAELTPKEIQVVLDSIRSHLLREAMI